MASPIKNQKGITLVEVIVSVLLVTVVVTSVIVTVAQSSVYSNRIDMIYQASNLAKARMDDIKILNFSDLAQEAVETDVQINEDGEEDLTGSYMRTTEVAEDHDGNPYLTKVKVSVDRITDGQPSGHPVIIETLMADIE